MSDERPVVESYDEWNDEWRVECICATQEDADRIAANENGEGSKMRVRPYRIDYTAAEYFGEAKP